MNPKSYDDHTEALLRKHGKKNPDIFKIERFLRKNGFQMTMMREADPFFDAEDGVIYLPGGVSVQVGEGYTGVWREQADGQGYDVWPYRDGAFKARMAALLVDLREAYEVK